MRVSRKNVENVQFIFVMDELQWSVFMGLRSSEASPG